MKRVLCANSEIVRNTQLFVQATYKWPVLGAHLDLIEIFNEWTLLFSYLASGFQNCSKPWAVSICSSHHIYISRNRSIPDIIEPAYSLHFKM